MAHSLAFLHPRLPERVQNMKLDAKFEGKFHGFHLKTFHKTHSGIFEEWEFDRLLGEGGSSVVHLEKSNGRQRAVKRFKAKYIRRKMKNYQRELEALWEFSQEMYADYFVKFHGWFQDDEYLYILMEYCERGDLDAHLENRRENGHPPLPEKEVQGIARQVVQGICYMHRKKFAHRDLKPSNILIKPSPPDVWKVKIGDLGLSKQVGIESIPSTIHGTKDFMPPERDIWSLGLTIYQLLTLKPAFEDDAILGDYYRKQVPFPSGPLEEAGVSQAAIDFVRRCMAAKPEERMDAEQANQHYWIKPVIGSPTPSDGGSTISTASTIPTGQIPMHTLSDDDSTHSSPLSDEDSTHSSPLSDGGPTGFLGSTESSPANALSHGPKTYRSASKGPIFAAEGGYIIVDELDGPTGGAPYIQHPSSSSYP